MVSARESRHPRWPVPAHAFCALAGLLALVLTAGTPAPSAAQDARPLAGEHVLVGMTPNTGYEVTCDDSLLSLEPVNSSGLGIMEFIVDPRATGSPTKICVRVPAPPAIFGEEAAALTDTSVVVLWQTDRPARSRVEYGPTTSYGWSTPVGEKLTVLHNFAIDGLEPQTTYHCRLHSTDAFGNESVSDDLTFQTLPERPRILGLGVSAVTDSSITLSWSTTSLCEARIDFGTENSHESSSPTVLGYAVKHEVTVHGLEPDVEYLLAAVGTDTVGREVRSEDILQRTEPPLLAVLAQSVVDTTMTTAVIGWSTTTPSRCSVDYGPSDLYGWTLETGSANATEHLAVLEGLTAGATYHYRIRVEDVYGQSLETEDAVFSTKPEGTPENLTIHKIAVDPLGTGSVAVSWVTNLPASSSVSWGRTESYTETMTDSALVTKHAVVLDGLDPGVDYHALVSSVTDEGAEVSSDDFLFWSPPPDLQIQNAQVESVGSTRIALSWSTNFEATGWIEYGTSPECALSTEPSMEAVTEHALEVSDLEPLTGYYLRAAAAIGDYVVRSVVMSATTAPPELLVSIPVTVDTTASSVTVVWSTSLPSYSHLRYGESAEYGLATGTNASPRTEHATVITGLSPASTYHLQAVATDTSGRTAYSEDVTFETPHYGPLAFREVSVYDVGPSFASISWQTSHESRGVLRYGLTETYTDSVEVDDLATDHSVVVTGLSHGTAYHMSIRAVDTDGQTAISYDMVFETSEYQDLSPPHAPEELALEPDGDAVVVSWAANPEHDLAGYRVYRRSESDTTVALVDDAPSYRTTFRDANVDQGMVYEYAVSAYDGSGNVSERCEWTRVVAGVGAGGRLWAWPNPLVDRTNVRLALPASPADRGEASYSLRIYDASGRLVRTLASGRTSDVTVTVVWDGRDERNYPVSSGVYFCVAEFAGGGARSKLVVLR